MLSIKTIKNKLRYYNISLKCKKYDVIKNTGGKKIAIVSAVNLVNKLAEDLYLKYELLVNGYNVDIIGYDDNYIDYSKYDLVIIRSIYGYHKNLPRFMSFLKDLENSKVKVCNDINLIKDNYDKKKQYDLFLKYNLPVIDTKFIYSDTLHEYDGKHVVIKPSISASGENTFVTDNASEYKYKYTDLIMVQPYIKSVEEGEYSLIYFDGCFSHAIKRWPGITNNKKSLEVLEQLPNSILELGNKVSNIYKDYLFLRVDIIKDEDKYRILESELIDPSFFLGKLNAKNRNKKLKLLIKAIKSKVS